MEAYIKGSGSISAQDTFMIDGFPDNLRQLNPGMNLVSEPNYKEFIQPIQLRRMGRVLRMGVTAAAQCLKAAGVDVPDAIITGTGLGLVQDTEKFLTSVLENDEKYLNPTSFIQSTHNTVGAHIAVMLKCNSYNCTYVHSNISFESALLDSHMQIAENPEMNILLGGLDEMTESYYRISDRAGLWNKYYPAGSEPMIPQKSIVGEGAAFSLLTGNRYPENYAKFTGVSTFYKPGSISEIATRIAEFLDPKGLKPEDIDFILLGQNDPEGDYIYNGIQTSVFNENNLGFYKHLCGEYHTSSAFASWVAANCIKNQVIPDALFLQNRDQRKPKNILI